ncbi:hypothetical protein V5O48_014760 [Marasmius crinis-equi]|uniref:Uncharacterized protein n=1 Tax=Marasmius crinis-equi TaxID=585013 RepID=A0ABR3EWE1_9AGAR
MDYSSYAIARRFSHTHYNAVLTFVAPHSRRFRHLNLPVMHSGTWEFLRLAAPKKSDPPQELTLESLSLEFAKYYIVGFDDSIARSFLPRLKKLALCVRDRRFAPETLPLPWGQITELQLDTDKSIDIQTFLNLFTSLESLTIGSIPVFPLHRSFQISLPRLTTLKVRVPSEIHDIQHISNLLSLISCPSLTELTIEPLSSLEPQALITFEKSQGCDGLFRGVSHMLSESGCFDTISTFDIHEIPFHYSSLHSLLEPMTGLKRLSIHRRGHAYADNLAAPVSGLKLAVASGSSCEDTSPVTLPLLKDLHIVFEGSGYDGDGPRIARAEIEILRIFESIVISRLRSHIPLESAVLEFATGSDQLPFGGNDLEALRELAREENAAVQVVWCGTDLVGSRYELGGEDSVGRRKSVGGFPALRNRVKAWVAKRFGVGKLCR